MAPFGGARGVFKSFVADCLYVENAKDVFLHRGEWGENFSTPVLSLLLGDAVRESV